MVDKVSAIRLSMMFQPEAQVSNFAGAGFGTQSLLFVRPHTYSRPKAILLHTDVWGIGGLFGFLFDHEQCREVASDGEFVRPVRCF